jgi:hypothetical protein
LQSNHNHITPAHYPRSSQTSAEACSQNAVSARPSDESSGLASKRHWRRHSAAMPGARVSGSQIWTGRKPIARNLERRRVTRSRLDMPMPLHVAITALKSSHNVEPARAAGFEVDGIRRYPSARGGGRPGQACTINLSGRRDSGGRIGGGHLAEAFYKTGPWTAPTRTRQ